jgi:hypothetical protein
VHPIFHSYHYIFCRCLKMNTRLALLTRADSEWLEEHGYNQHLSEDDVFIACIAAPDSGLFREWIVFPCAIAVLLLICSSQIPKAKALWNRYTESSTHKKQQHDPGYLIIDGNKCTERSKNDTLWCALRVCKSDILCCLSLYCPKETICKAA